MTTLAERLGFAADAKLLIIHRDDLGMCHSEKVATRLGEHVDLCWFHDTVHGAGEIPLKYLRQEVDEAAEALLRELKASVAESIDREEGPRA